MVASLVTRFTAYGLSFYIFIVITGKLSHECPFQNPLSPTLRSLGINSLADKFFSIFSQKLQRSNPPNADCVFWTLDLITDPEVTTIALRHLTNIGWHYNPLKTAPLPRVARIYLRCSDSGHRILTEFKDMAYAAGRALLQLHIHRLCSNKDSDCTNQAVTEAFEHLSSGNYDGQLRSLSLIVRNIQELDWSIDCPWEMAKFDLLWISGVWIYYAWLCRTRSKKAAPGNVIIDRNISIAVSKLST